MKNLLPRHVGFIPDGNRRWAQARGREKQSGYREGIEPGIELLAMCKRAGIDEVSIYGYTQDNMRRPAAQAAAFRTACVSFAERASTAGAALAVIGDHRTASFPEELRCFRERRGGGLKVNLLANYGWAWDIEGMREGQLRSSDVSRIDLVVRWGGGRRLSGFLPVQCAYADIYVLDALWPDFEPAHFESALDWFREQDRTLGG